MKRKIFQSLLLACSILSYGASDELVYMGSVGTVTNPGTHILEGDIEVSGISKPTRLTLDLVLPNGMWYEVSDLTVKQDGTYSISEVIDSALFPTGQTLLNISANNSITEEDLNVDVSLKTIEEVSDTSGLGGSSMGSITMANVNRVSGYSARTVLNDDGSVATPIIAGSLATRGDSAFLTNTQESSDLPSSNPSSSIEEITYDANNMVIGVSGRTLTRDEEGNVNTFTQTATETQINTSQLEELKELFGTKTKSNWQTFDWNSSITQAALDYLLAVHKGQITNVSITLAEAKELRQALLARLSYVNRNLINGCLSGYDLDFSQVILQYCDWRGRLKDLTGAMLVQSAGSILNVSGNKAGIMGACFDEVIWTGTEDVTNMSMAYVYTGSFVGITAAQMATIDSCTTGTMGIVMSEAQTNEWTLPNAVLTMTWGGYDYWDNIFNQIWMYMGWLNDGTENEKIVCNY